MCAVLALLAGCSRHDVPFRTGSSVASGPANLAGVDESPAGPAASPVLTPAVVVAAAPSPSAIPPTSIPPPGISPPAAANLPSAERSLTIVQIGDSLGMDLGYGMRDVLAGAPGVTLVQAAKGNSGLVQPQYYDWPRHLRQLLTQHNPQVVVVFLGANDVQDFYDHGVLQRFGTAGWQAAYAQRVASLMQAASEAGSAMLWVGMPIMASATFANSVRLLNAIYQQQAAAHPGVSYFSSWELFSTADGQYARTTKDAAGRTIVLRTPDGIHVTFGSGGAGADYLARAVVAALQQRFGLAVGTSLS